MAASRLDGWRRLAFDWPGETRVSGQVYSSAEQSLLALDGVLEMAVLRGERAAAAMEGTADSVVPRVRRLAHGEVHSHDGWAVWRQDGMVRELWVIGE